MKIFQSTQKSFKILGFVRQAFDTFSINKRNVIILSGHVMCATLPSIYVFGSARDFNEFSEAFYCIACGFINFANLTVMIFKVPGIFSLMDDLEETIAQSMFGFYYWYK